jgi:hypothetical protein
MNRKEAAALPDFSGMGADRINEAVRKLSRDEARQILSQIAQEAEARKAELKPYFEATKKQKKAWEALAPDEQARARQEIVAAHMFHTLASSALLDALTKQSYSFTTSQGTVFELYGLHDEDVAERLAELSPDERIEVYDHIEGLIEQQPAEERDFTLYAGELWKATASTYFGIGGWSVAALHSELFRQRPDLSQETIEAALDVETAAELLEMVENAAEAELDKYPYMSYDRATMRAAEKIFSAYSGATDLLDKLYVVTRGQHLFASIGPVKPAPDVARRILARIERLQRLAKSRGNNQFGHSDAIQHLFPDYSGKSAERILAQLRAAASLPSPIKTLAELSAERLNRGQASKFLDGTIGVSDAATHALERSAGRPFPKAKKYLDSLREERANIDRQSRERSRNRSAEIGL